MLTEPYHILTSDNDRDEYTVHYHAAFNGVRQIFQDLIFEKNIVMLRDNDPMRVGESVKVLCSKEDYYRWVEVWAKNEAHAFADMDHSPSCTACGVRVLIWEFAGTPITSDYDGKHDVESVLAVTDHSIGPRRVY